jgi:hypothetical protein
VLVAAEDREPMLQGEGRDPGVVGRDRAARSPERNSQRGVGDSGLACHLEEVEVLQMGR